MKQPVALELLQMSNWKNMKSFLNNTLFRNCFPVQVYCNAFYKVHGFIYA